ncbi:Clp protease N-terminal domain-containing protein [Sphaerisporangium sp. TRM90804]|uniref:Clp protease N-terminal domain-containing protein n=1 Tax=Sphaerisporangium sp. TRM90804 TaxID=3031113 RepID=UPI00244CCFF3|nr:Clp protease N-terminal domain-containing protein [Sphaerisporangium sp. TRM90804]MDH2426020.1 Clp protease N-terminal domain-containing protein [Sphaerisporangium sp. TRM90804]
MSTIDHYINDIVLRGAAEAREEGSAATEAHHLLLAIAAVEGTAAHRVLTAAGFGRQAIRDALDREFEHSLNAVGVSLAAYDLPKPFRDPTDHPKPGASARLALERGFAAAKGKKDLRPAHLLLGVLSADVGTVPRALALAGLDRAGLMDRVEETLARESW